jgi:hypothetical protein
VGANIIECLKPDKAYELVDDAVKLLFDRISTK